MERTPHILFLPKWYPHDFDEFEGNFIEAHAEAVAKFCQVTILFVKPDSNISKTRIIKKSRANDFNVISIYYPQVKNCLPLINGWLKINRFKKAQREGFEIIQEQFGYPDLAHVHVLTRSAFLALWLKKKFKIPFLISEHWSGYFPENGRYRGVLKKWFTKYVAREAAALTTVSAYLKKHMERHQLRGNYTIIPNVVDIDLFGLKPTVKRVKKVLLHISTLYEEAKNVSGLLKTVHKISQYRKDFQLILVGDSFDGQQQRDLAKSLELDDLIEFTGNVSKTEVAKYLQASDVLVQFSNYENQPCVMGEAYATGTPIIITNVGGISEFMNEELGIIIPPKDEMALEKAINTMLDGKIFDIQKLRAYSINTFSNEVVGKQFYDLYQSVLST